MRRSCHSLVRSIPVNSRGGALPAAAAAAGQRTAAAGSRGRVLAQAVAKFSQAAKAMKTYDLQAKYNLNGDGLKVGESCGWAAGTLWPPCGTGRVIQHP